MELQMYTRTASIRDVMRIWILGYRKSSLRAYLIFSICSCLSLCGAYAQTYTLSDGDVVDCIPIENQPSLKDSPNPTYNKSPTTTIHPGNVTRFPLLASIATQTFASEVGTCPNGTIPVLRNDYLGVISNASQSGLSKHRKYQENPEANVTAPHEYAIAAASPAFEESYKGTEVIMTVWDPYVEANGTEFSLAQLWISRESFESDDNGLNTVEAGYQVETGYGFDNHSRLFVYWTADNYNVTGCYDLECPGFIQVSNKVLIRGSFMHTSEEGPLYEIKLRVFQDSATSDWWLFLNDEVVGYWPSDIFTPDGLQGPADTVEWGGEIVDDEEDDGNRHTKTDMGSGQYASNTAAYMRNLQYIDSEYNLVDSPIALFNTSAPCYSVGTRSSAAPANHTGFGSFFYFGGPGYNSECLTDPGGDPNL